MLVVQTEFFALQGLSKLVEIVQLIQKRMNPALEIATTRSTPSRLSPTSTAIVMITTVTMWPSMRATASAR